jgi:hypothetical protein
VTRTWWFMVVGFAVECLASRWPVAERDSQVASLMVDSLVGF